MRQDDDTVSQPKARFHTRSHKKALYSTTAWYQTGLRGLGCLSMHSQVQAAHYVKSDDVDKDMIKRYIYIYVAFWYRAMHQMDAFAHKSTGGLQEKWEIITYLTICAFEIHRGLGLAFEVCRMRNYFVRPRICTAVKASHTAGPKSMEPL